MKVKEAIKLLESNGFIQKNQVGSHVKFIKDSKRVTVVNHGNRSETIHPKTVKTILNIIKD